MLNSLFKTLLHSLHSHSPFRSLRSISTSADRHSFTVSYLIKTCGLSPKSALRAAKHVSLGSSAAPDSVIDMFKSRGFSESQISATVRNFPRLLLLHPERILLPKINYLSSVGFSSSDIIKMISFCPGILGRSLEKRLIRNFVILRDFLGCDKIALASIKRCPSLLYHNFETYVLPKINLLRRNGVSERNILLFVRFQPSFVVRGSREWVEAMVAKAKGMGFNPMTSKFYAAMLAFMSMSESTWERKLDAFARCGWSKEDAMVVFMKYPLCMTVSEEKIMAVMEFFVHTMGYESSELVGMAWVFLLSLEKRIVPRCLVVKFLMSRGLIDTKRKLSSALFLGEDAFLEKFVTPHLREAPRLLNLYQEKMGAAK